MNLFAATKYDDLLMEVLQANDLYRRQFAASPTVSELSEMTGASEEHILESMEFGQATRPTVSLLC
ncbi:MAG TPA: hypothetical protein VFJ73_03985 [Bacillales bacterium]|nr:hypothetical protein [Bacillales bacterium]